MIVTVPVVTPDTIPVAVPIAAIAVLLLPHVPPVVASVSAAVLPVHTIAGPAIAEGKGFTVTTAVIKQPVPNE